MKTSEDFNSYVGEALQFINFLEEKGIKDNDNVLSGTNLFTFTLGLLKRTMYYNDIDNPRKLRHVNEEPINLIAKSLNFLLDYGIREQTKAGIDDSLPPIEMPKVLFFPQILLPRTILSY